MTRVRTLVVPFCFLLTIRNVSFPGARLVMRTPIEVGVTEKKVILSFSVCPTLAVLRFGTRRRWRS